MGWDVHIGQTVELKPWEIRVIKRTGTEIDIVCKKNKCSTAERYGTPEQKKKHNTSGLAGEYAFAKLFNLFVDLQPGQEKLKDRRWDFVLYGKGIDLKTIDEPWKNLLVRDNQPKWDIDVYALMIGDINRSPIYTFAGFIEKSVALTMDRRQLIPGGNEPIVISRKHLKTFSELKL